MLSPRPQKRAAGAYAAIWQNKSQREIMFLISTIAARIVYDVATRDVVVVFVDALHDWCGTYFCGVVF
jgi:hypothetical protein